MDTFAQKAAFRAVVLIHLLKKQLFIPMYGYICSKSSFSYRCTETSAQKAAFRADVPFYC
jgi:hypothetical protein